MYSFIENSPTLFGATGGTINSSASSILFFWKNWQYYSNFHRIVKITEVYRDRWHGDNMFGTGDWYLSSSSLGRDIGVLVYFQTISFASITKNAVSFFRYTRISDNNFWYCGGGLIPIQGPWRYLQPLISFLGKHFLVSIGAEGGRLAQKIWHDESLVLSHCGPLAFEIYKEMKNLEKSPLETSTSSFFSDIDILNILSNPGVRELDADLSDLIKSGIISGEAAGLFRAGLADFILAPSLGPFTLREAAVATLRERGESRRTLISAERRSTLLQEFMRRGTTSESSAEACRQLDALAEPIRPLLPTYGKHDWLMMDRCRRAWGLAIQIAKDSALRRDARNV